MSNNPFVPSNRTHDPTRGLPSISAVPACTFVNDSGQEFIDTETHQMALDAMDAAYRQESSRLVRQRTDPAKKAELKAFLAEFNLFDNVEFDLDIYSRPWIIKKRAPNDTRPIRRPFTSCYDFKAVVVKKVERDKTTEWIYVSFRIPYKSCLLVVSSAIPPIADNGQICWRLSSVYFWTLSIHTCCLPLDGIN